jgi:NTP pyrophosphatase (non-canonical NTP hydrolase)
VNFDDFTKSALRTWDTDKPRRDQLANAALGLAGEAGEAADLIKKHLFHGHELDTAKIRSELGDVLYYVAILANEVGLTLEEIAEANSAKLKERYPEGFDPDRSQNRPEPTPWGYPDNAPENRVNCGVEGCPREADGDGPLCPEHLESMRWIGTS